MKTLLSLFSAATALCAQQPPTPTVPAPSATSLFPPTTTAVIEFSGLEACADAARDDRLLTYVRSIMTEQLGVDPMEMISGQVLSEVDQGLSMVGLERSDVRSLLRGRIAFAASRLTFFDEDEPMPAFAFAIEAGGNRGPVAERVMDRLFAAMQEQASGVNLQRSTRTVAGQQLEIMKPEEELGSIAKAKIGDWMVLTSNEAFLVEIAETAAAGGATLRDAEGLAWARPSNGTSLSSIWLNVGPFYDALGLILPYEADPILKALGLNRLHGLMIDNSALEGGSGQDTLAIAADHTEDGLLAALVQGGVDTSVARYFPDTTFAFGTMNVDVQRLLQAGGSLIDALPGKVRAELFDGMEEMDEELGQQGLSLRGVRDTVAQFGNQIAFGINVTAGIIPDGLIFVGTRRAGFADKIAGLAADYGIEVGEQQLEDIGTVRWLKLPDSEIPITPSFVEVDGGLLLGTSPNVVKGAARRGLGVGDSLTSTPDFAVRMQAAGSTAGLFLLRTKAVGADVYANALPFLRAQIRQMGEPIPAEALPDPDELRDLMEDVILTISRDRGGIRIQGQSQFTNAHALSLIGFVLDEVMSQGLGEVR